MEVIKSVKALRERLAPEAQSGLCAHYGQHP